MRCRYLVVFGVLVTGIALASMPVAGQTPRPVGRRTAPTTGWAPARTSWGDPDLRGVWRSMTQVPFERPKEFGVREFLTDAELAAKLRAAEERRVESEAGRIEGIGERGLQFFNNIWSVNKGDRIRISRRTSAIIDPPNGRLPPWTPEQVQRWEAKEVARRERGEGDSWEDRGPAERCINVLSAPAAPMLLQEGGGGFNPVRRILQAPRYVAMVMEENIGVSPGGEFHIIPLDPRPALGPRTRLWLGDARGHWEGNTLVVETTNVNDKQNGGSILPSRSAFTPVYPGTGEKLRIIERFTLLDADTLEYRYTIEDPDTYTRPYTVLRELTRDDKFFMDPAQCQENNESGMLGILAGARADEQAALEGALEAATSFQRRLEERKAEWAEFNKSR